MRQNNARKIALGGMMAALAVVIMCLGGLIPIATYVCPILCCLTAFFVLGFCGKRIAWAWYIAVAILALLMSPDKEAAVIFLFLGYYPLIKLTVERRKLSVVVKFLFFNVSILAAYWVLIQILGLDQIAQENAQFGIWGIALLMVLGNVTFFLLDRLLSNMARRKW